MRKLKWVYILKPIIVLHFLPGIAVAARGIKEYDTVNIKYRNSKTDSLSEYLGLAVTLLRPTTEVGDWGTFPTDTSRYSLNLCKY